MQTEWFWRGVDQEGIESFIARDSEICSATRWCLVQVLPELLVREGKMNYQIRSLGYDSESDELDLLINADSPLAAEAVPLDAGVYIRRDFKNGQVVGAFIRGYQRFACQVAEGKPMPSELAEREGLGEIFRAIVAWQREVGALSHELAAHLGVWPPQDKFMEILVASPV
jgi:hypothetical protein